MAWRDDEDEWSFEEEPSMASGHSRKKVVKDPDAAASLPSTEPRTDPVPPDPMTPEEYQRLVLEKMDEIIVSLNDLLVHLQGG